MNWKYQLMYLYVSRLNSNYSQIKQGIYQYSRLKEWGCLCFKDIHFNNDKSHLPLSTCLRLRNIKINDIYDTLNRASKSQLHNLSCPRLMVVDGCITLSPSVLQLKLFSCPAHTHMHIHSCITTFLRYSQWLSK